MSVQTDAIDFLASPLAAFRPWTAPGSGRSPQREFMSAAKDFRYRIYRGGNRTGKTTIAAVDTVLQLMGWHPYIHRKPPVKGWAIALDWETVGQVLWPKLKTLINLDRVKIGWQRRVGTEIPESLHFPNGSSLIFRSAEAGREKVQGADLDFAWIDEEIDGGIVEEIEARLLDRAGNLMITLTPVCRKAWVSQLERKVSGGGPLTKVVRASMRDAAAAGIISKSAVNSFLDNLPDRQRAVRDLGDYSALEGLVYPEYSDHTHILRPRDGQLYDGNGRAIEQWPLPKSWHRYGGIDFGFAVATAVPILAEDPATEHLYVERCYYASNVRISKWAEVLRKELPPLSMPLVADHQAFEREELQGCGIVTTPAKKDVWPGLEAVERALNCMPDGRPRLQFVVDDLAPPKHPIVGRYDAHWLTWELSNYRYKERDSKDKHVNVGRDLPVKKDDHACDATRYLITALEKRYGADAPTVAAAIDRLDPLREMMMPVSPWGKRG